MSNFQKNLKVLANKYTQKYIADRTGFSQSSINNYLTKSSEPSIQFLIALKNAFGICLDDFLFSDIDISNEKSYDRFIGNYIVYYYNNNSYKGEVHVNVMNTLNYGVISILKEKDLDKNVVVYGSFIKSKSDATKHLKDLNKDSDSKEIYKLYEESNTFHKGNKTTTDQSVFLLV